MGTSGTDKFHEYRDPEKGTSKKKDTPTSKAPAAGGPRGSGPAALRRAISARNPLPT